MNRRHLHFERSPLVAAALCTALLAVACSGDGDGPTQPEPEPPPAPEVETRPATQVTATSARITGFIDPKGLSGTWNFQLGLSADALDESCGSDGTIPAGADPTEVSCDVTDQPTGRVIHYRVWAETAGGRRTGETLSVTIEG